MHILGAQHASDPANPKPMGFISHINGCSDMGAARHGCRTARTSTLTACLMWVLGAA